MLFQHHNNIQMAENQNTNPILDVKGLNVWFGQNQVLSNFALALAPGEALGLVGESGSGKSISALSLMGLLPPGAEVASGSASLFTHESSKINLLGTATKFEEVRGSLISMIFQEPMTSLNPSMRCGRQVEEAISLHNELSAEKVKAKCLSLLREMQLPSPEKAYRSYPHQLSGGQKQRVMIAIALAGNPSVLIADEPTTALDVTVQKEILNLLKGIIAKRRMSLIFISHDLGVVSQITSRLMVLKDGCIVEEGPTAKVLSSPTHPYTKGLIACRPPIDKRPKQLPTVGQLEDQRAIDDEGERDLHVESETLYIKDPLLEIKGLSVDYVLRRNLFGKPVDAFRAVDSLSLDLYPGETLGLVGESGCGKTTLGRAILGLAHYQNGTICYKGKDIKLFTKVEMAAFRQDVQLVFQDPYSSLNPRHTVGEALMEPIAFYDSSIGRSQLKSRAKELLEYVSLSSNSFYRYPHEFSGGQRQRIAIARALSVNPKVLVCDEMVSALDVSIQALILNLLNRLKYDLGLTFLFISHDLSVVKYMSNRILVMQNGRAVELGPADSVYNAPQSDYTKRLIGSVPKL